MLRLPAKSGVALAVAMQCLFALGTSGAQEQSNCDNGAPASKPYCKYFFFYNRNASYTDSRLTEALSLGSNETTRSVAMILGVSKYAEVPVLTPAKNDVEKLKSFLLDSQHFDEIVLLEDEDVNLVNINYFLQTYIRRVAKKYTKTRILFTYTGHGLPPDIAGTKGYMFLSQAKDPNDTENLLGLGQLAQYFLDVSPRTFQFLALINSCYGGDLFGLQQAGGNIFLTSLPAANAITAGAPDELVWSEGKPGQGTIFFEAVVDGITSGQAAGTADTSDVNGNRSTVKRDVVRLGDLLQYLTAKVANVAQKSFSTPWEGSVVPPPQVSKGGFFFLSGSAKTTGPVDIPSGPASSLFGRPDTKIFNEPYEYPVQGIDVSRYDGDIDWEAVHNEKLFGYPIKFAFARATMGSNRRDENFAQNWEGARVAGLARGAYHTYDVCQDVEAQIGNIEEHVPVDLEILPVAIDIEFYPESGNHWQQERIACFKQSGATKVREDIMHLLTAIEAQFKKTPIIFGNKDVFGQLLDENFSRYSVWLHDYQSTGRGTELPGRNPWTMWQYTDAGKVKGVEQPVDVNAFFGTLDDFEKFKNTGKNLGLEAVYFQRPR
jgi:GH25 family lysozyme M1 (1,4-beta-N-acetylmuramidase)